MTVNIMKLLAGTIIIKRLEIIKLKVTHVMKTLDHVVNKCAVMRASIR